MEELGILVVLLAIGAIILFIALAIAPLKLYSIDAKLAKILRHLDELSIQGKPQIEAKEPEQLKGG